MPHTTRRVAAGVFLAGLVLCGAASAQEGFVGGHRLSDAESESLSIDGRLSETVWTSVPVITGFTQREPEEGDPATERTEVRIAYDDAALYVAIMAYDSRPDEIVARILQRDRVLQEGRFGDAGLTGASDDVVAILLDPFHDHRNGVVFATNPNGAEFEALLTDEGSQLNVDWRAVWEVAGTRTADGWSAEFAIPWQTLRYPDAVGDEPWGINVYRMIRRSSEEVLWQSWEREGGGLHRVSRAGHLSGLIDLPRQGLNLEAKPYVLTGRRQELDGVGVLEASHEVTTGLDLKTELRPGLLLDVTANTDFAQVEVDDAQVNLTRFNLFFPEKRDFFLENSGVFDFGIGQPDPREPPPYQMFFSRRIGISDDGEVPILGGARLTGRVGGQTIGFMSVMTDEALGVGRENFSVGRVKRDVGESNYVGAMVVDRRGDGDANTVAGADAQFVIGEAWVWDAAVTRSFTEGAGGDGTAYAVAYEYRGRTWSSQFSHYGIEEEAQASAGFITRTDFRSTDFFGGYTARPSALGLRQVRAFFGGGYASTISDGRMQEWEVSTFISPTWESADNATFFVTAAETVVDDDFTLSGVDIPAGRYRADRVGFRLMSSASRALSFNLSGSASRFHGGSLRNVSTTMTAAPSEKISFSATFNHNGIDVPYPDGEFFADITSIRAGYSFSTKLSTTALVQFNHRDQEFSSNVRFNYIHRPGSDLFIVFTENRGDGLSWTRVQDRGLVMKVTYLMRL